MTRRLTFSVFALVVLALASLLTVACASVPEIPTRNLPVPADAFSADASRQDFAEIAYVGVDRRIYVTNRSGSLSLPVTDVPDTPTTELLFDLPTWSPDGSRLAFMGFDSTDNGEGRSTIYVADFVQERMDTSFVSLDNAPFYMAWDPRGDRLSFLSSDEESSQLSLQVVDPDGRGYEALTVGRPMYFSWSPGGDYIAVHAGGAAVRESTDSRVSIIDMAGDGAPEERRINARAGYFQAPSFSPAGRRVAAAVVDDEGNRSLEVYASDGERLATVSALNSFAAFDWSPTGEQIAFIDGFNSPFGGVIGRFRLIDLTGESTTVSLPVQQEAPITAATAFFWSPDGSRIAILETLPAGDSQQVSRRYLTLSILNTETRQVRRVGPFIPTAAFLTQVVPFFDQYQRSTTPWAPDSSALVISAVSPERRPGIYLIDLANLEEGGAEFSQIAEGRMAFWRPLPAADTY